MSVIILPGEAYRQSIALQTREKWDIPNSQSFEISYKEKVDLEKLKQRYSHALFRTGAIPIFNCHGLTFASRRSCISETTAIQQIVSDDRYEQVSPGDVQPGDIILYISSEDGDIEHSGVVIEPPKPDLYQPKVWSKWGFGAEVIHYAGQCPYDFSQARYYRIRS
jgi:hypothetical protein